LRNIPHRFSPQNPENIQEYAEELSGVHSAKNVKNMKNISIMMFLNLRVRNFFFDFRDEKKSEKYVKH